MKKVAECHHRCTVVATDEQTPFLEQIPPEPDPCPDLSTHIIAVGFSLSMGIAKLLQGLKLSCRMRRAERLPQVDYATELFRPRIFSPPIGLELLAPLPAQRFPELTQSPEKHKRILRSPTTAVIHSCVLASTTAWGSRYVSTILGETTVGTGRRLTEVNTVLCAP